MIHSCFNKNQGKYLHETCLWLIYSDKTSSYEELLDKDKSVTLQQEGGKGVYLVDCENVGAIFGKSCIGGVI